MSIFQPQQIEGQVIYLGPQIPQLGLGYGNIFKNGIHQAFYDAIEQCPSLAQLFVPIANVAEVRKQLNFDLGRNMRGTTGPYVTLYRDVMNWRAKQNPKKPITIQTN